MDPIPFEFSCFSCGEIAEYDTYFLCSLTRHLLSLIFANQPRWFVASLVAHSTFFALLHIIPFRYFILNKSQEEPLTFECFCVGSGQIIVTIITKTASFIEVGGENTLVEQTKARSMGEISRKESLLAIQGLRYPGNVWSSASCINILSHGR